MRSLFFSFAIVFFQGLLAQNLDCAAFRNGNFILEDLKNGNTMISRSRNTQIETMEYLQLKIEFKVKWLDDCTYTLKVKRVLENPRNIAVPTDMVVKVKILETTKDSYTQQSSSKGLDKTFTSVIKKTN
jgi:hypothetical protein